MPITVDMEELAVRWPTNLSHEYIGDWEQVSLTTLPTRRQHPANSPIRTTVMGTSLPRISATTEIKHNPSAAHLSDDTPRRQFVQCLVRVCRTAITRFSRITRAEGPQDG